MSEQKKPWEQSWNQPAETSVSTQNKKPWEHKWNGNSEPEVEKSKGFSGHVRDIGASLAAGAASLPDVAIGIGDTLTGGAVGKTVEDSGLYTPGSGREYWADKKTDQAKAQSQKFSDAEGIIDKTKVALTNPTLITNTVAESLPTMVAGGLVGRGLSTATKGAISPMVGGAIGEGTMMAGSQAENIRQQTDDGLLTGNQVAASVATGALGTLFGLAGGAVAKKFGFGDIDSMLAGANAQQVAGEIAKVPLKQVPKHVVLGALSEGLLEELPQSAQEQVLQNYALNKDLMDGVDDAIVMGALAGMTMGGAASGLNVQGHNQRYNAQEQLKVAQQAAQQAQETQAMRDAQSQLFGGDVPDPVLDPSKLNPFSDNAPIASPIIDMNRLEAADGNPRYENGVNYAPPEIATQLSLVDEQPQQADNGIDFERPEQGQTDLERQIQFNNTFGLETPDPVVDYNGISPFDNNPQKPIIDSKKVDLTPSEQMGLDPNLGPLSAAAATAVDNGVSQQMQIEMQAQTAAETASNVAGKTEDSNAPLQQAADAARELTPEQIHGKQNTYGVDVTTAIEQLKQRQQGEQNAPITFDEGIQNATAQQGNAPLNNGSQPVSEQHDTNAASAMGAATGAAQKGLQPAKSDADQIIPSNQSLNEIQTSEAKSKLPDIHSKVTELEAQLVTEKSVPKKAQIRKQITELQNELSIQTQSDVNIDSPQKSTVENHRENFAKMDRSIAKVNAVRQRMREANPEIFTEANDRVRETHGLTNARVTAIADEIESSGSYELSDREYDKIKNNPNYKIDYNPKTFTGKVIAVKDQHSGEWLGNNEDSDLDNAAHAAATSIQNDLPEPTQAQIEAGNYKKGHIKVHGLDIAVENPRGSERRGTDPDGKEWAHKMSDHYGYIKKTTGADNEHIDTYVGRNPESEQVFIVDQIDQKTGGFDEHKVMMGFHSQEEAVQAYSSNFDKGWKVGPVRAMNKDEFKSWLKDEDTKKPAGGTLTNEGTTQPPGKTEKVYTPGTNREIEVRHKVVEADDLITSNDANGAVNPNFPKHLQPRDRSRPTSIAQVHDIASKLNPKLLGENPSTASGAPIVSAEGVVESGNGRTMAIRKSYETDKGEAYKQWLGEQGYDVSGMKNPVLVRERTSSMTDQELRDYTRESNESSTLTMSPTEQAMVDAKAVVDLLDQYRGGDINSAANRDFVNRFVTELVPTSERGKMLSAGTGLTQDGQRRINAALVAAAYNDTFIVDQVFESTESDIKAIGNALTDVAGFWAKMRDMAINGQIPKDLDVTPNLVEAVHLVQKARVTSTKLADLVAQDDIFSGAVDSVTLDFLSVFYRGDKYPRARGRERVADALNHYAQQAMQQSNGENLFGDKPKNNTQLRGETLDRLDQQETDKQQDIFASPQPDDRNTVTSGGTGQRATTESSDAETQTTEVKSNSPEKPDSSKPAATKPKEVIQDFGEKIGGARKDTAVKTGKKPVAEKPKDDRPTWAKRFEISEIAASSNPAEVGKWTISDTKNKDWMGNNRRLTNQMFNSQEEAEKFLPVAAVAMKHRVTTDTKDGKKGYIIVRTVSDRKHVQVVQQLFDTRDAANEYLVRHAQEILETNTTFGELDLPRPENTQRTGVARREGDAKDSDFSRVFGFRGVEFGNWNNQAERQELLNDAFDGLMDLAEVLNIPPEALSLNGELALAFGARGQGLSSAKAHYESNRVVINLTKMNGAGSLAHEWWHAFDHYLSRQDGSASSAWIQHEDGSRSLNVKANPADRFASHGFKVVKSGVREDVRNNFEKLMVTMFKKSQAYIEDTQAADEFVARSRDEVQDKLNSIRENLTKQLDPQYYKRFNKPASADQLAEFDTAAELIITGQLLETEARKNPKSRSTFGGYRHTNDALDKINEIFKAVRGRSGFNADFKGVLDYLRGSMSRYMGRLKLLADAQQSTTKYKSVPTEFAMNAKELDQGRGSDYWTTPHEMSARAFQGYVEDKIAAKNARSPFLNYGPENVGILTPYGVKRPFPSGEERVAINQAFDDLIGGLQTKKTDTGTRLYSRAQDNVQSGQTPEQVREALVERFGEKTISSLERRGLLDIVSTVDEPGVEGFYQNGRVTLVANNLNETSIIPTFLHELGGHGGFQNVMSEEKYADLMGIFNDMVQRKHPLALEAKRLAERETDTKTQQLEYLPYLLTLASTQQEMNALQKSAIKRFIDQVVSAVKAWAFDRLGINLNLNENDLVALANRMVNQIGNQAQQNTDTNQNPLYSRQANAQQIIQNLVGNMNKQGRDKLKTEAGYKATHALQYVLGALGRRQLTELYQKLLPQLKPYNDMVAMMDADQNEVAALSDDLARRWADLKDEKELANVMHDATLAKIDPAKPYQPGDNVAEYAKLKKQFDALSGDAKKVYREARDAYKKHHRDVRQAIQDRILRSSMSNQKKTELLQQMDANFFGYTQGVYFPLQRFGKYVVVAKNNKGEVLSVSRAETLSEAHKLREVLLTEYPGSNVLEPKLDKEFNAARDGVGRGFMTTLFNELGSLGLNAKRQTELEDILGQLYLKSLPDLSYAKHSIHRKGTAGFSQDARRAFAQNMFHGGSYLAKLRYKDQLEEMLDGMQKHANDEFNAGKGYDQRVAQQVIDEMNKRHKNMMEANSHPLSTALTSLGFLYYLGLSPASAAVNTLQTVLVAYPQMGAKWGYDKAGAALAQASNDFRKGVSIKGINPKNWENDIAKILKGDELKAYEEAVRRGVIDVTMAHDLAGIAQGEDSGVMWKLRPVMRVASTLFHNAERFNREVTFIAAYRLARDSGSMHDQAFEQAMDSTYKGHFDYSSGNRPRIMQGNIAKVILLFKQFGQNMIYTLARTAHQSLKGETPEARREAQRALAGIIGMHTVFAGVMGLPLVGPILAMASMLGSDDDEPWDAEVAIRNWLADTFGQKTSEVLMKGASRFGPADLSGRVGINNLLLPNVQDGLEGKDFSDAMVMSALGPVVGILTNTFKGLEELKDGYGMRGVETMSPVFLRSPLRSIRYATEGSIDKTKVVIKDDVGMLSLAAQAVGFSPSEVRLATEGRSAIYSHTKRLDNRRDDLMNDYVRAVQRDDMDGQKEIWAEIQAFNQKNPSRRISRVQAMQSLRQREKRVKQAEHGIYLPNKKREDADIGRFAFDE
ncbi:PLxRFG domain-containing protein [Acinetobacter lwoffii]|uniref:PLxRFG domain-containing protein n=1 Tax=Acinetobacter lwoffii TaxID=28090 RepID=UPI003F900B76